MSWSVRLLLGAGLLHLAAVLAPAGDGAPATGPATEKRFPRLVVPPEFEATLFACDPLIEYPSVIAAGPRPGSILAAVDFMTGLGTEIVRRDEIRLVEDTDGDGYADRAPVFADGFNAIMGLARQGDTVFVMHAPLLTALRDVDGDGKADERKDLLTGLGLKPEDNLPRLHCANGVVPGHDGWLYLALGDHGCDVPRPEGDRLVLRGGGILRCRPDGHDLHVFATGLRNIYDVALDDELNVFVRDNENDGGDYMVRVAHSQFGADHGYPYLYRDHPNEALPPLADLGRGSSAGGVCYRETAFPASYRGGLFFCEWGRGVMFYRPERKGSAFGPVTQVEFATGAQGDPYGFKPTDLVVQSDGSLFVSDWCDGQRPQRGRGRIYRIAPRAHSAPVPKPLPADAPIDAWIERLDSPSAGVRGEAQDELMRRGLRAVVALKHATDEGRLGVLGRLHAVWILARVERSAADLPLLAIVATDPDARVQAQAIRALADVVDPVLATHRLDGRPGDPVLVARLAALTEGKDASVVREAVILLGRMAWRAAPAWLVRNVRDPDPALAHAAMQTLRRCGDWNAVLKMLDLDDSAPCRAIALRALAERDHIVVVTGLIALGNVDDDVRHGAEYLELLARVAKKPGPWKYWGYRPPPRPANTIAWEWTVAIERILNDALSSADRSLRLAALKDLQRAQLVVSPQPLLAWLRTERAPDAASAILESVVNVDDPAGLAVLEALVRDPTQTVPNRRRALAIWNQGRNADKEADLVALIDRLGDGPVLADALRLLASTANQAASGSFVARLAARDAETRAAAIDGLSATGAANAGNAVAALLNDRDPTVRRAAATAVGRLGVQSAARRLAAFLDDRDATVRSASLDALGRLGDPRAARLAESALADPATRASALACLEALGQPEQAEAIAAAAARTPTADLVLPAVTLLAKWSQGKALPADRRAEIARIIARLQGQSGYLACWRVAELPAEPLGSVVVARIAAAGGTVDRLDAARGDWRDEAASGTDARLRLKSAAAGSHSATWLACAEIELAETATVRFVGGADGRLRIWLNGDPVHRRDGDRALAAESEQFDATLSPGPTRIVVAMTTAANPAQLQLRFRRKGSTRERERLMQLALGTPGDPERGRRVFLDVEKSQCLKCHRMGVQGGAVGPDLTGVGKRLARAYIAESILEPSRAIAPSFDTIVLALSDGRTLTGVPTAETSATVTLADRDGRTQVIPRADIEERRTQPTSLMPEGLEQRLTADEFVDLIGFLASQK